MQKANKSGISKGFINPRWSSEKSSIGQRLITASSC